ncbi:hypothetical protein [Nocardioides aquaticus]|nr:hypothetical protein [Nocardioides aquaticus]
MRAALDQTEGELLISRDELGIAYADLLATTDRLLPTERNTKP